MHWDNIDWADQISLKRTEIKEKDKANFAAGDDRCPPDTWKGCVYNDGEFVALPTDNIRSCFMKAGAKVTLKDRQTFKKAVPSGVIFSDLFVDFLVNGKKIPLTSVEGVKGTFQQQAEAVKALGFSLLVKRAKIGSAKHVRVRPIFKNWSAAGTFNVTDQRITETALKAIVNAAGLYIGIGDWRPDSPQSPGPHGCFTVELEKLGIVEGIAA